MIDPNSDTWRAVEAWARHSLDRDLAGLESAATTEAQTQQLRGRVQALRRLLALPVEQAQAAKIKSLTFTNQ